MKNKSVANNDDTWKLLVFIVIFSAVVIGGLLFLTKDMKRYSCHQNRINDIYEEKCREIWESKNTYIIIDSEYPKVLEAVVIFAKKVGFKPVSLYISEGTSGIRTYYQSLSRDSVPILKPYKTVIPENQKN